MKAGDRARALIRKGARPDLAADLAGGVLTIIRSAHPAILILLISVTITATVCATATVTYFACRDPQIIRLHRAAAESGIDVDNMPFESIIARLQTPYEIARIVAAIKSIPAPEPDLFWTAQANTDADVSIDAESINDAIRDLARYVVGIPKASRGEALADLRAIGSWNTDARNLISTLHNYPRVDLRELAQILQWFCRYTPEQRVAFMTSFPSLPTDAEHLYLMGEVAKLSPQDVRVLYATYFAKTPTQSLARRAFNAIATGDRTFIQIINTLPTSRGP